MVVLTAHSGWAFTWIYWFPCLQNFLPLLIWTPINYVNIHFQILHHQMESPKRFNFLLFTDIKKSFTSLKEVSTIIAFQTLKALDKILSRCIITLFSDKKAQKVHVNTKTVASCKIERRREGKKDQTAIIICVCRAQYISKTHQQTKKRCW